MNSTDSPDSDSMDRQWCHRKRPLGKTPSFFSPSRGLSKSSLTWKNPQKLWKLLRGLSLGHHWRSTVIISAETIISVVLNFVRFWKWWFWSLKIILICIDKNSFWVLKNCQFLKEVVFLKWPYRWLLSQFDPGLTILVRRVSQVHRKIRP